MKWPKKDITVRIRKKRDVCFLDPFRRKKKERQKQTKKTDAILYLEPNKPQLGAGKERERGRKTTFRNAQDIYPQK